MTYDEYMVFLAFDSSIQKISIGELRKWTIKRDGVVYDYNELMKKASKDISGESLIHITRSEYNKNKQYYDNYTRNGNEIIFIYERKEDN